jgi:methyl-CpG-binding domain protein 4
MAVILGTMGYCLMANTTPLSDDLMVQQQISGAWQHMVGVIMLNQTGRKPVKTVLPKFLSRWPTPEALLRSRIPDIEAVIKPLGMYRIRARRIYKMSIDFLTWDGADATMLHGIGQYGSESYRIFFLGERFEPADKELRRYLGYKGKANE